MDQAQIPKVVACFFLAASLFSGCRSEMKNSDHPQPSRPIEVVLAEASPRLMALPDVVGVYQALLDDQRSPCIRVMLGRANAATSRQIPPTLEGYPVRAEITGEIKPLRVK